METPNGDEAMSKEHRSELRTLVRGAYDLQKMRIQAGNRIVANFKAKLGQRPSRPESEIDEQGQDILKNLRLCYDKITEGVIAESKDRAERRRVKYEKEVRKAIEAGKPIPPIPNRRDSDGFPSMKDFAGDELISSYAELCLISMWANIHDEEARHMKRLESLLKEFKIYEEFLREVRGVGPAMSAVICSEIDITKARYASSLWAYAGLDVSTRWVLQRTRFVRVNMTHGPPKIDLPIELNIVNPEESPHPIEGGEFVAYVDAPDAPTRMWDAPRAVALNREAVIELATNDYTIEAVYREFTNGGRSNHAEHLVLREYEAKDGTIKQKKSITYNPFLKTKLMGVLAPSFLKCGPDSSAYAKAYYDYKNRLENHATYGVQNDGKRDDDKRFITTKARRHTMAMRYAVKIFLADLYGAWRKIEGLPVHVPYAEAKLGHRKHGAA